MATDELLLLRRFVATGDAGAFSQIVHRHVNLVYGACIRILADADAAADATQETFFQFLKKAGTITGSLPAWLHRVATCKAIDAVRAESARRRAENRYAEAGQRQVGTWKELAPELDEALDALDDPTRELLIEYYFQGRSLAQIGADKGVSHPTVSRRLNAAIAQLRRHLRKRGVIVSAAAIAPLLSENAAQAAPAGLVQELAKMILAGAARMTAPAATAAGVLLLAAKAKVLVVAVVISAGVIGVVSYRHLTREDKAAGPVILQEDDIPTTPVGAAIPGEPQLQAQTDKPTVARETPGASEPQPAPNPPDAVPEQPAPGDPPPPLPYDETPALDLSSPEATVRTFIKSFVASNPESVMACMAPKGTHYHDVQAILQTQPGDKGYDKKLCLQAFDPEVEMPVIEKNDTPDGVEITWLVTFKTDFAMEGLLFGAGRQVRINATMAPIDGEWLIDSIIPNLRRD